MRFYKDYLKRGIDIVFSFTALLIISPLILIIALILLFTNKGKIFFLQIRPGINASLFKVIKFKTMNDKKDKSGRLLPDEERITVIGRYIRSTSIDEIPQLINILKGDMSFIGPRPLLPKYIPLYSKQQFRRHEVLPGITGWAQVNGRNNISWKKKLELDVWYVDNVSFWLDLKIIFLTIKKVILREGVSKSGFVTTEPFSGNN